MSLTRSLTRPLAPALIRGLDRSVGGGGGIPQYPFVGATSPNIDDFAFTKTTDMPNAMSYLFGYSMSPDGVFVYGPDQTYISQWTLSTPWDFTTVGSRISVTPAGSVPWHGIAFSEDGVEVYAWRGGGTTEYVYNATCSTPWDLGTIGSWTNKSLTSNPANGSDIIMVPATDNGDMWILDSTNGNDSTATISWHRMSTPGDVSTLALVSGGHDILSYFPEADGSATGMDFAPDGMKVYIMVSASGRDVIYQYNMTEAFDLATATFSGRELALDTTRGNIFNGFYLRKDTGTTLYVQCGGNSEFWVEEYDLDPDSGADPDFDSVVLLLDFKAYEDATNITDLSNSAHVDTFVNDAKISRVFMPTVSGFSLELDGTGDYITFPDHADWDFGTGDFTIEFHFRCATNAVTAGLISNYDSPDGWSIQHLTGGALRMLHGDTELKSEVWDPTENATNHVAICRSGTSLRMFINGTELGTATTDSTDLDASTAALAIGALPVPTQYADGFIANVRITKGVARYTENFTAPVQFYPRHGPAA